MKNNIGNYIQMEGFLSTSLSYDMAADFAWNRGNTIIEIRVETGELGGDADCGFANLEKISSKGER